MNTELKKARVKLREIEKVCKKRPLKTPEEIKMMLEESGLFEYVDFGHHTSAAAWAAEWILHTKRINKSRV